MLDKILQIEKKYKELGETLSDPAVIQDYNRFRDLSKQRKSRINRIRKKSAHTFSKRVSTGA